jgi:hypothetical protein
MQNMRDYFISGGGGGGRPRTLSGEKCYPTSTSGNANYPNKHAASTGTAGTSSAAGTAVAVTGQDMMSLSELPVSPFDGAMRLLQQGGEDRDSADRDERSANTGTITEGDKGSPDTDEMFDFEDTDALDEEEEDDEEEEGGEAMPFAWAQQSTADSYVFNKGGVSHMPEVSSDGGALLGHGSNISGSAGSSASSGTGMVNLNQSFIAQQCMAPPMLTSFTQESQDERSSMYQTQDMVSKLYFYFQD